MVGLFLTPLLRTPLPYDRKYVGTDEHTGYPFCVEMLLLAHAVSRLSITAPAASSRIWKLDCDDSLITLHYDQAETGKNDIQHSIDAFWKLGEPSLLLL